MHHYLQNFTCFTAKATICENVTQERIWGGRWNVPERKWEFAPNSEKVRYFCTALKTLTHAPGWENNGDRDNILNPNVAMSSRWMDP